MTFSIPSLTALEQIAGAAETLVTYGSKLYMIGSEIFTVSALLWCLNFLSNSIEKTYNAGKICGKLYYRYLHKHAKWLLRASIALTIFLVISFISLVETAYRNRKEIAAWLNSARNTVGSYFVYRA